jgi:hypothetical protein
MCETFKALLMICCDKEWQSISNDLWMLSDRECIAEYETMRRGRRRDWTREKDRMISELYVRVGPRWRVISSFFEGRSSCQLKYRWHTILKRKRRAELDNMELELAIRAQSREHYPWLS